MSDATIRTRPRQEGQARGERDGANGPAAAVTLLQRYGGWILVAAGALCILAGYLGISRQALVAKQLPYLISGGIFGLALVAVGTFYVATEQLRRDSGRLDRLETMVNQLHAVLLSRADAPVPTLDAGSRNGPGPAPVVALPDAGRYHQASCPMVAGKAEAKDVSAAAIRRRKLQPCDLCEPPDVASLTGASAGQTA